MGVKMLNAVEIWIGTVKNENSWVLFEHGTVVIFLPLEAALIDDLRTEAINRLKNHEVKNIVVAELIAQGMGWIVNCGNDFILGYVPHGGDYPSRYDRMAAIIEVQKLDQQGLKIVHVEKK